MKNLKSQISNLKFLVTVVLVVLACGAFAAEEVSKVLASVNGQVITSQDLEEYCQLLNYSAKEKDKKPIGDMAFRKDSLLKLIEDRLILGKAKTEKIDIPAGEIDSRINSMRSSFPTPEAFEQFMLDKSLNTQTLRDKVTEQIIVTETIDKYVKAFISNSPQEISKYYQDHQSQLVTKPMYTLLVAQGADISKLEEIAGAIKSKGGDEAIKAYSDILVRAETGLDELKEELAAMAKQCKEGERAIKTFDGKNYLVYVEKIVPERQKDLLEATKDIDDLLWKQKYEEKLAQWLKELKEKAVIVVYPPYGEAKIAGEIVVQPVVSNQTAVPVANPEAAPLTTSQAPVNTTIANTTIIEPVVKPPVNITAANNQAVEAVANQTNVTLSKEPVLPEVSPLVNQTAVNQTAVNITANP